MPQRIRNSAHARNLACVVFALILVVFGWAQAPVSQAGSNPSKVQFNGNWWDSADSEERSGFLNGAADCLTWTAHEKGFNATPEQLAGKISKFYETHPESVNRPIIDVWRNMVEQLSQAKNADGQGELWKNAHWYLNGDWWAQISESQRQGFVEGYLWCMRTQVPAPADVYSASPDSYREKIDAFVRANPKLGHEAVATTLRRFRDKDAPIPPA